VKVVNIPGPVALYELTAPDAQEWEDLRRGCWRYRTK
jgi:hypothetical protein